MGQGTICDNLIKIISSLCSSSLFLSHGDNSKKWGAKQEIILIRLYMLKILNGLFLLFVAIMIQLFFSWKQQKFSLSWCERWILQTQDVASGLYSLSRPNTTALDKIRALYENFHFITLYYSWMHFKNWIYGLHSCYKNKHWNNII